jgi:hypothetical protein
MKKSIGLVLALTLSISGVAPALAANNENPYGTSKIDPAAPNEVILSITKGKQKADFAYPRLLKLKHSTISIYEPFLKKRQTFTVIQLKTLFNFVGISGKDKVVTKALNDYIFTATAADFISAQGYLAIKRDGVAIAYDQGGPIRIVFPDNSKWSKNLDAWNWSLASISVK